MKSILCWTSKNVRRVAEELRERGHAESHQKVAALLDDWGTACKPIGNQGRPRTRRSRCPVQYISRQVSAFKEDDQMDISVEEKKKENIGDFLNPGREWHRCRRTEEICAKDFPEKRLGKAIPEGVYDLSRNEGCISVGVD